MSKKKKNKTTEVYMQITKPSTGETSLLRVPFSLKKPLDYIAENNCSPEDYHNGREVLHLFCEKFVDLKEEKKHDFEAILNSGIAKVSSISDLYALLFQTYKYYRLKGISNTEKLGKFFASQAEGLDNWISSKNSIEGENIKRTENGRFYNGDYIGVCRQFLSTDD